MQIIQYFEDLNPTVQCPKQCNLDAFCSTVCTAIVLCLIPVNRQMALLILKSELVTITYVVQLILLKFRIYDSFKIRLQIFIILKVLQAMQEILYNILVTIF